MSVNNDSLMNRKWFYYMLHADADTHDTMLHLKMVHCADVRTIYTYTTETINRFFFPNNRIVKSLSKRDESVEVNCLQKVITRGISVK